MMTFLLLHPYFAGIILLLALVAVLDTIDKICGQRP